MAAESARIGADGIAAMRDRHLRELNAQFVHYSWLDRGFSDAFALAADGRPVGYGLVGAAGRESQRTITEFFVEHARRDASPALFRRLIEVGRARAVVAQSNDPLLTRMLHEFAQRIEPGPMLFADAVATVIPAPPGATFRRLGPDDRDAIFAHEREPVGEWGIEIDGRVVATGGVLLHYNPPFADLHMEVAPLYRRRGVGAYLVQELKRVCRESRRVPERAATRTTWRPGGVWRRRDSGSARASSAGRSAEAPIPRTRGSRTDRWIAGPGGLSSGRFSGV